MYKCKKCSAKLLFDDEIEARLCRRCMKITEGSVRMRSPHFYEQGTTPGVPAFIAPTPTEKPATPQEILEKHETEIAEIKAKLNVIEGMLQAIKAQRR